MSFTPSASHKLGVQGIRITGLSPEVFSSPIQFVRKLPFHNARKLVEHTAEKVSGVIIISTRNALKEEAAPLVSGITAAGRKIVL